MKSFVFATAVLVLTLAAVIVVSLTACDILDDAAKSILAAGEAPSVNGTAMLSDTAEKLKSKRAFMCRVTDARHTDELVSLLNKAAVHCSDGNAAAYAAAREEAMALIERMKSDFGFNPL